MAKQQQFRDKYGPWALVTGASAGIGEEFAYQIAAAGLNLVLVARRAGKLSQLADTISRTYGVEVRIVPADLSQPNFMDSIRPVIADIEIGLLVNNAGVYGIGEFLDNPLERELTILNVNTRAPLILSYEIGQQMRARGRGGIIIVASTGAYQGVPYIANYAGTKAYDLIFAEGLWYEMKQYGVDVLGFSPGGTRTEGYDRMAAQTGAGKLPAGDPVGPVVTSALNALGKKPSAIPGAKNNIMTFVMTRLMPRKVATTMFGSMIGRAAKALKTAQATQ